MQQSNDALSEFTKTIENECLCFAKRIQELCQKLCEENTSLRKKNDDLSAENEILTNRSSLLLNELQMRNEKQTSTKVVAFPNDDDFIEILDRNPKEKKEHTNEKQEIVLSAKFPYFPIANGMKNGQKHIKDYFVSNKPPPQFTESDEDVSPVNIEEDADTQKADEENTNALFPKLPITFQQVSLLNVDKTTAEVPEVEIEKNGVQIETKEPKRKRKRKTESKTKAKNDFQQPQQQDEQRRDEENISTDSFSRSKLRTIKQSKLSVKHTSPNQKQKLDNEIDIESKDETLSPSQVETQSPKASLSPKPRISLIKHKLNKKTKSRTKYYTSQNVTAKAIDCYDEISATQNQDSTQSIPEEKWTRKKEKPKQNEISPTNKQKTKLPVVPGVDLDEFEDNENIETQIVHVSSPKKPTNDIHSFHLPKPTKPVNVFAHVDVVRKKEERELLPATDCPHCRAFYEAAFADNTSAKDIDVMITMCSRHREEYNAPHTPPGYWETAFPPTQNGE